MSVVKQKVFAIALQKRSSYMLAVFIFGCLISYVLFANMAVHAVTKLEKTKENMQTLAIEVSELEGERLTLDNKVNVEMARVLGFVEVQSQTFIVNKNITLSLKTP